MAQNFRRYISRNVGTSTVTLHTADSYDTIIVLHWQIQRQVKLK